MKALHSCNEFSYITTKSKNKTKIIRLISSQNVHLFQLTKRQFNNSSMPEHYHSVINMIIHYVANRLQNPTCNKTRYENETKSK